MHADVELGEIEAEDLEAPTKRRRAAVGNALRAVLAQAPVEQLEVGAEVRCRGIARPVFRQLVAGPSPAEAELAAVRLVGVAAANPGGVGGNLTLGALDRRPQP